MNRTSTSLALSLLVCGASHAQTCPGGYCYPPLPSAPARLVLPQSPVTSHESLSSAHCRIQVADGTSSGNIVGSGTLISKNENTALVLTCSHLFDTSTANIVVTFPSGDRYGARLVERDRAHDLAALLIRIPHESPLEVDDTDPAGLLTACGFGGDGRFTPVRGAITGAAQAIGATFPSLKIAAAVRPGDSGGGVLNTAGQLVGVVWGCRDGETYLTCGTPLRNFLARIQGERASARGNTAPTLSPDHWRTGIEARLTTLESTKQPRGDYLERSELTNLLTTHSTELNQITTSRIDSLKTALFDHVRKRIEEQANTITPGLLQGLSTGKLLAGALGLSGPVALAVIAAGALAGRRLRRVARNEDRASSNDSRTSILAPHSSPIAVDTPPPPQQTVPESHYVPVERDSFARAHQWAREQVARKYPGATEILSTLESLIKQQLAGGSN